jgi:hypothetical protein
MTQSQPVGACERGIFFNFFLDRQMGKGFAIPMLSFFWKREKGRGKGNEEG